MKREQYNVVYEFLEEERPPDSLEELLARWFSPRRAGHKTVLSSDEVGENTNTPTPTFFI
jgi:hypothetical protein